VARSSGLLVLLQAATESLYKTSGVIFSMLSTVAVLFVVDESVHDVLYICGQDSETKSTVIHYFFLFGCWLEICDLGYLGRLVVGRGRCALGVGRCALGVGDSQPITQLHDPHLSLVDPLVVSVGPKDQRGHERNVFIGLARNVRVSRVGE
jgi:hypothetical protein